MISVFTLYTTIYNLQLIIEPNVSEYIQKEFLDNKYVNDAKKNNQINIKMLIKGYIVKDKNHYYPRHHN